MQIVQKQISRLFPLRLLPKKMKTTFYRNIVKKTSLVIDVYNHKMIVPLQIGGIGRALALHGHRELDQYTILHQVIKPGDVFLDLGANIGYYAIIAGKLISPGGKLMCFEPDPRNVNYLRQNIELNKLTDIAEYSDKAVSDFTGETTFNITELSNLNSIEPFRGATNESIVSRGMHERKLEKTIPVKTISLSDLIEQSPKGIDAIRMDVEGHEVQILGSLAAAMKKPKLAAKAPRVIVFEPHHWEYVEGHDLLPVMKDLYKSGYRVTWFGTRKEDQSPIAKLGFTPFKRLEESSGRVRGVYKATMSDEQAMTLACRTDGVTTVCLERAKG